MDRLFLIFRKIAAGGGGGDEIEIAVCEDSIHVSVYMHVNVCTVIVQNDNA